MSTIIEGATGQHRGNPAVDDEHGFGLDHCCFGGCDLRVCPDCTRPVCRNVGLHRCVRPYTGRHRAIGC